jgi:hypothetical protein
MCLATALQQANNKPVVIRQLVWDDSVQWPYSMQCYHEGSSSLPEQVVIITNNINQFQHFGCWNI